MTEQQYRVIADRDRGDDPKNWDMVEEDDRVIVTHADGLFWPIRIERPVLTTEAVDREGYDRYLESYTSETEVPMSLAQWREATAEPSRIEDLVPGTTFKTDTLWTVERDARGLLYAHTEDERIGRYLFQFDPSTIRDITPPKENR